MLSPGRSCGKILPGARLRRRKLPAGRPDGFPLRRCNSTTIVVGTASAKTLVTAGLGELRSQGFGASRGETRRRRNTKGSRPMENNLLIGLSRQVALQRE